MIIAGVMVGVIVRLWVLPKVYAWAITRPYGPVFRAANPNRKGN